MRFLQNQHPTSAPVDRSGVIRAWLGEGPTVAAEIQCALRPLL